MIRVTITDRDALLAISPDEVARYLERTGWTREADILPLGTANWNLIAWRKREMVIVLPSRPLADWASVFSDILNDLARIEDRSALNIYCDISPVEYNRRMETS